MPHSILFDTSTARPVMEIKRFLYVICSLGFTFGEPDRHQLKEVYSWDILDFEFPPNRREEAIATETFIPNLNAILSTAAWRDKMFVGLHRYRKGTISSLNYFPLNTTCTSPVLIPYPSFDANYVNEDPNNLTTSLPSESSVISSGYIRIDKCDRLWIIDSGHTDFWGKKRIIAPPAIVIFDLNTDALIRRFVIPNEWVHPAAVFMNIDIDIEGNSCDDVHAYVVDMHRAIVVYSFRKNRDWLIEHDTMASNPEESKFSYAHVNLTLNYGILPIAVGETQDDSSKNVYFAPLASIKMYSVSNRILQDESYTKGKYNNEFHLLGNVGKKGHANEMVYDAITGVLINLLFGRATIGCWNTHLPFEIATVHKTSNIFFPVGASIDANRNLWIVSNQLALNVREHFLKGVKNTRLLKETFDRAIHGTKCTNKLKG